MRKQFVVALADNKIQSAAIGNSAFDPPFQGFQEQAR